MYPRRITTAALAALVTAGAVVAPATIAAAAPSTSPPVASVSAAPPTGAVPMSVGDPSLSPTPYQGWNTYYGLGGDFTADRVSTSPTSWCRPVSPKAGYDIVWLDGGWQADCAARRRRRPAAEPGAFPDGMDAARRRHPRRKGLRAGIYTDAGPYIPGSVRPRQRRLLPARRGQVRGVGLRRGQGRLPLRHRRRPGPARRSFTEFAQALRNNSSHRPMIFNLCNPVTSPDWGNYPEEQQSTHSWTYAPGIARVLAHLHRRRLRRARSSSRTCCATTTRTRGTPRSQEPGASATPTTWAPSSA